MAAVVAGAGVLAGCGSAVQPAPQATTTATVPAGATAPVPVAQLVALARRSLPGLGDVTVTSASVVTTTKRAAEDWLEPGSVPPGTSNPRAYLIVLDGRFVCQSCSRPSGATAPRGTSAQFLWVPGTGVTDFGLTARVPTGLSHLGRVVKIGLGRPLLVHGMPPPGLRRPATRSRVVAPPSMERGTPVH